MVPTSVVPPWVNPRGKLSLTPNPVVTLQAKGDQPTGPTLLYQLWTTLKALSTCIQATRHQKQLPASVIHSDYTGNLGGCLGLGNGSGSGADGRGDWLWDFGNTT